MRYDWNRNRYGRVNRYLNWLVMSLAVLSWPLFASDAFLGRDWTLILAALIITVPAVLHRAGLVVTYGVRELSEEKEPAPVPEPKAPRDTSRSYPRPKGSRSKLNRTCPVCGTGQETGKLDGRVLGWPAHRTCAEWLGDWEPQRPAPPPYKPDPELIGHMERGQKGAVSIAVSASPGAQVNVGDRNTQAVWSESGTMGPVVLTPLAQGIVTAAEARERLNQEIIASWGVPPAILEEHTRKAGDPLPVERCPECGAQFVGTPGYLREAYKLHRQLGCRAT